MYKIDSDKYKASIMIGKPNGSVITGEVTNVNCVDDIVYAEVDGKKYIAHQSNVLITLEERDANGGSEEESEPSA